MANLIGRSSELYKYWNDNSRYNPCLGEAKMATTTINILNSFSTIFERYLLFFKRLYWKLDYKFMNHNITF